jgi:prophage antirepressor-like protein
VSNIIPFDFKSQTIRVIQDDRGELMFVVKDAADILGYRDAANAVRSVPGKHKGTHSVSTQSGTQNMITVDEPGLYRLVLRSDKPEAEPFMEWVTSEVLPAIRKTGSYSTPTSGVGVKPLIEANRLFKSNLTIARAVFKGNQALLSANMATRKATDVDVLGNIGATHLLAKERDALLTATDIGQQIGLSGKKVNLLLEEKGLVVSFRDHKNRKQYELTEDGEKFGEALDTTKKHSDGTPVKQIKWYSRIIELLKGESVA